MKIFESRPSVSRLFLLGLSFCALILCSSVSQAQMLVAPQTKSETSHWLLTPTLAFSDVDYKFDGGGTTDVDRSILGMGASYGLNRQLDVYGELGYVMRSELDSGPDNDGIILGGGVKGLLYEQGRLSLLGLAGVRYISESYGQGLDGDFLEVPLAVIARGQLEKQFGIYGGIDVLPFSDGEIDGGRGSADVKRDDIVGLRLGADYKFEKVLINAEFSLISEESFLVRLGIPL